MNFDSFRSNGKKKDKRINFLTSKTGQVCIFGTERENKARTSHGEQKRVAEVQVKSHVAVSGDVVKMSAKPNKQRSY